MFSAYVARAAHTILCINRIMRDVWDSMGEEWNRLVMLGEPVRAFTPEELIERRCEDALRQCGLPRSLRRLPPF